MTPESVTIVLPLPAKVLQPNCTIATIGGRFMKARAIKHYRKLACEAIERERIETKPWSKVAVQGVYYHKTKRRRDEDNAKGALKAVFDGITDSGLILDDDSEHMTHKKPVFKIDKVDPRVELIITRKA